MVVVKSLKQVVSRVILISRDAVIFLDAKLLEGISRCG